VDAVIVTTNDAIQMAKKTVGPAEFVGFVVLAEAIDTRNMVKTADISPASKAATNVMR